MTAAGIAVTITTVLVSLLAGLTFVISRSQSLRAKVYALTGRIPQHVLDDAWVLYSKDPPPNQHGESPTERQPVLLVAFAGGAVRIGGVPIHEFRSTCSQLPCDVLCVTDPHQLWYIKQHEQLRRQLADIAKTYKHVMMVGNCLGGTGALLFADIADKVVVFGPQTTISHAKSWYWLNGLRLSRSKRLWLDNQLQLVPSKCKTVRMLFSPHKDTYMSQFADPNYVEIVHECTEGVVPQWLKKQGKLTEFLGGEIRDMMAAAGDGRQTKR